jgi:hypothetical protein
MYHARYTADIVVTTAYKAYQGLPGILTQYANTSEFWRLLSKIGVRGCPLLVQLAKIRREVEVVLYEGESVVFFGSDRGRI